MKKLSNIERLQALIAISAQTDDYFLDVKKVGRWISNGHEWAINWEYDYFDQEPHPLDSVVEETASILKMFRHAKASAKDIGDMKLFDALGFEGFDGNNDPHYGVVKVMVDDLGKFGDLPSATANSHSSASIDRYRDMLTVYKEIEQTCRAMVGSLRMMSEDELKKLAKG